LLEELRETAIVPFLKRVLVIDDDEYFREFMQSVLEGLDYECIFPDVTELLEGTMPEADLVVVDLMMPKVDGIEVLRALANRKSEAQVILMSGIAKRVLEMAEKTARSLGLRVVGSLQKPFRLAELWSLLEGVAEPENTNAQASVQPLIADEELHAAIEREEFQLYYQPQIRLANRAVIGFEGLVRWNNPVRGMVPPNLFIDRCESLGLIEQLTWIVVKHGFRDLEALNNAVGSEVTLSLNMSVHSLQNLSFPDQLHSLAELNEVAPEKVVIEITESGVVSEVVNSLDVLTRLRMKGFLLSIDDFGTGYSMMEQLQNVPATELKIDQVFVAKMAKESSSRIMVEKIIELGHQLEMQVVGEGVETQEQMTFLKDRRCDIGQGYLFCRPVPLGEISKSLRDFAV